jgi:hypothetical protein
MSFAVYTIEAQKILQIYDTLTGGFMYVLGFFNSVLQIMVFIMAFSYMYTMNFDHIYTQASLLSPPQQSLQSSPPCLLMAVCLLACVCVCFQNKILNMKENI